MKLASTLRDEAAPLDELLAGLPQSATGESAALRVGQRLDARPRSVENASKGGCVDGVLTDAGRRDGGL